MKGTLVEQQSLTCQNYLTMHLTHLNFDLLVAKEGYQVRNNARVNDHLDLLIASISQIRQSPHCVHKDLLNQSTPYITLNIKSCTICVIHTDMYNQTK